MKRLVYSPKTEVYVKADSGVYDLSSYITSCTVNRKVNQVSQATVTFRNPQFIWTNSKSYDPTTKTATTGPIFHPMDPIVIVMTRIKDKPIQVFTGFCDTTPYLQLYPGLCTIQASCTLKRLRYTYFDPALQSVWDFLGDRGWIVDQNGNIANPAEEAKDPPKGKRANPDGSVRQTDGSIGGLLYDFLREIGGWSDDTIYIENLPTNIVDTVENLYAQINDSSKASQEELHYFLEKTIGTTELGSGAPDSENGNQNSASGPGGKLDQTWEEAAAIYSNNNYKNHPGSNGSNVGYLLHLYKDAPQTGKYKNDRKIIERISEEMNVPFPLMWATYGAESSWGDPSAKQYFGLTGLYPSGTSGSFEKDARIAAQTWARLYRQTRGPRGRTPR